MHPLKANAQIVLNRFEKRIQQQQQQWRRARKIAAAQ